MVLEIILIFKIVKPKIWRRYYMIEVGLEHNALYLHTKYNKKMSHSAVVEILKRLEGVSYDNV